jgi:hypothetical protein
MAGSRPRLSRSAVPPGATLSGAGQAVAQGLFGIALSRVDPGLLWALFTNFKGYGGPKEATDLIPFLVELRQATDVQALAREWVVDPGRKRHRLARIPQTYRLDKCTRFCTVRVMLQDVPRLLTLAYLVRAEMGLPGVDKSPAHVSTSPVTLPTEGTGWGPGTPMIGVIDHGIAFAHRHFHLTFMLGGVAWRIPRIVRLWDQWSGASGPRARVTPPWLADHAFGYGRVMDAQGISQCIAQADEMSMYHDLAYSPVLGRAAHGTHVLDVAAGPLNRGLPHGEGAQEAAAVTPIIAVQLPWLPEKDVSGASLCVHVLDALRFISDTAGPDRSVAVNLSDGALAGSHNAASLIEAAVDELLESRPGLSLVVAAGNAYRERTHAEGLIPPLGSATLLWQVLPDDRTESFLEIWFSQVCSVVVDLVTPGGEVAVTVEEGRSAVWPASGLPEVLAAGIHLRQVATGRGQLAMLALRPTRPAGAGDQAAPHGIWQVRIHNRESRPVVFDAWIERDDPPFGDRGPRRQSRFVDDGSAWVTGRNTLNSVATGEYTVVVGGYRLNDRALASYTAAGAMRDLGKKPTVAAPSDDSPAEPGLRAAGNRSGSTARMNGTSVAAPMVTRMIANALWEHPGAPQHASVVKETLRRQARRLVPPCDPEFPAQDADVALRCGSGWVAPDEKLPLP